jgi:hypothetical protein
MRYKRVCKLSANFQLTRPFGATMKSGDALGAVLPSGSNSFGGFPSFAGDVNGFCGTATNLSTQHRYRSNPGGYVDTTHIAHSVFVLKNMK